MKVKYAAIGNGLFIETTPEIRRIVPENKDNLLIVKMVYVFLETQYQSVFPKLNNSAEWVLLALKSSAQLYQTQKRAQTTKRG